MKLTIEIEMDNDAFADEPETELARVLRTCTDKFQRQLARANYCLCDAPEVDDKLLDVNGNTVGRIRLVKE